MEGVEEGGKEEGEGWGGRRGGKERQKGEGKGCFREGRKGEVEGEGGRNGGEVARECAPICHFGVEDWVSSGGLEGAPYI